MRKILFTFLFFGIFSSAFSQDDAAELAKKLANPIASLISIPFQNNTDYGIGPTKGTRNTLNFQPVIPVSINENLNMITRVVLPIVTQYHVTGEGEKQNGIGDALMSTFFSPSQSKNFTWGVGPAFLLPIGNSAFSARKFGVGPTAVALKQFNGWTVGGLVNQVWSVAGDQSRQEVSQLFFQPFLVYNWKSGAGIGANMEWTQNWKTSSSVLWLNPTLSAVTSLGNQKAQFAIGPRFNLASPDSAKADWGWRAVFILLFPK